MTFQALSKFCSLRMFAISSRLPPEHQYSRTHLGTSRSFRRTFSLHILEILALAAKWSFSCRRVIKQTNWSNVTRRHNLKSNKCPVGWAHVSASCRARCGQGLGWAFSWPSHDHRSPQPCKCWCPHPCMRSQARQLRWLQWMEALAGRLRFREPK